MKHLSHFELRIAPYPELTVIEQKKFREEVEALGVIFDENAAIGAGASSLLPEIHINLSLVDVAFYIIAQGFLQKVGSDVWDKTKELIRVAIRNKPKGHSTPSPNNQVIGVDLLLYIYFGGQMVLVMLQVTDKTEVEEALDKLPHAIEEYSKNSEGKIGRIIWVGNKKWEII